jgi:TRAP-type C4-dicarboxylate transport system substrate-binding protein
MLLHTRPHAHRRPAALVAAACAMLWITLLPPAASAQPIVVKMATLVPEGTSWHRVLKQVAAEWNKISGGTVRVNLYAGGTAGDDPDVVRKMNLGTLNAAVLTSVGLAEIDRSVHALAIPMAFDDYDEGYYVIEKMRPQLEAHLLQKGFVALNWVDGGWARFFTQKPVASPDDLRTLKLFQWAGDQPLLKVWQAAGFNPIPLPSTELATGLHTGLVQAFGASPQVAVITRYYENARNMTDLRWALSMGGTVIRKDTWDRIPADIQGKLLESARVAGAKLQAEIRTSADADVAAMKQQGLNVVAVDARTRELWRETAESMYPGIRSGVVPPDAFDEALKYRNEYRRQKAATKK